VAYTFGFQELSPCFARVFGASRRSAPF